MRGRFANSMIHKRSLYLILAGVSVALGLCGCAGTSSEAKKAASRAAQVWKPSGPSASGPTLAIVGGRRITMRDVDSVLATAPPAIREEYSDPAEFKTLVERIAQQWALYLEAEKTGIEDDPAYRRELATAQRQMLIKYYYQKAMRSLPAIPDSAMQRFYEQHPDEFKVSGRARVRHIQAPTLAKARDVVKRLRSGSTWEEVCTKYSNDKGSATTGGLLGYVTTDSDLVPAIGKAPAIVAAAFKLKEGETSEPLKSDRGWHVIRADQQSPAGQLPFKDVTPRIRASLEGERNDLFESTLMDSLKRQYGIVLFPDSVQAALNPARSPAELFAQAQADVSPRDRIELFERLISKFPNDKSAVQAAFMIGFTYAEELKDYPAARAAFEKFLREHPDSDLVPSAKWMIENMGSGTPPPGVGSPSGGSLEVLPAPGGDSKNSKP